jgi:ribosomal protein L19E
MIGVAQAAEGGLQGAGACSGPRGSPGQHARLWVSRCRLLKRRSSIVGGRSIFLNFQHPPENSMKRFAQAAEGGLQGAGACSGPRSSPGQHARLWVSRCRLLKRRSSIVGEVDFLTSHENSMIGGAQAAEGGLQGAGACSGPRGSPGQHARLWVSRCRLLKRLSSIVRGRSIFFIFNITPRESSMIRGAQAAEGGLQGAGACSGPRGSPGQHARLWVSRCRLLKRRSSIVGERSIFSTFQHPTGELDDRRCAGSGGRTPGCRRLLGASGQPGAACAPLGKQMPALEAPVQHRRGGRFSRIFNTHRRTR